MNRRKLYFLVMTVSGILTFGLTACGESSTSSLAASETADATEESEAMDESEASETASDIPDEMIAPEYKGYYEYEEGDVASTYDLITRRYEYLPSGNPVLINEIYSLGEDTILNRDCSYNELEQLQEDVTADYKENILRKYTYAYDENGLLAEKHCLSTWAAGTMDPADLEERFYETFQYDDHGNLLEDHVKGLNLSADRSVDSDAYYSYEYTDENGSNICTGTRRKTISVFDTEGKKISVESYWQENFDYLESYEYNEQGLISHMIYYDRLDENGNPKAASDWVYIYDASGNLLEKKYNGATKTTYEYDAFGNLLSSSEDGVVDKTYEYFE